MSKIIKDQPEDTNSIHSLHMNTKKNLMTRVHAMGIFISFQNIEWRDKQKIYLSKNIVVHWRWLIRKACEKCRWCGVALHCMWDKLIYISQYIQCRMKLSVLEEMLENVIIMCQNSEWGGEREREHQADMECSNYIFVISPYTAHIIRHLSTERIAEMKKEPTSISRKIFLSSNFFLLKGWQYAVLILVSAYFCKSSSDPKKYFPIFLKLIFY